MSTNYYAMVQVLPQVTVQWHIGQVAEAPSGHTFSFQGAWFKSWQDWKAFLTHNSSKITIKSGGGVDYDFEHLANLVEGSSKSANLENYNAWQNTNILPEGSTWLDPEGYPFMNAEFF